MNQTLELLIKLIDALAWPTVAVTTVFVLKSEIKNLLPIIKRLRIGPLEAEFEQKILEAQERYAPDLLSLPIEVEETTDDRISKLISIDPRSAILEAWRNLEHSLQRAVIQKAGSPVPDVSTSYKAIRAAMKLHLFTDDEIHLFNKLRGFRNQAAHLHTFNPTEASTFAYIQLATTLEARAKSIADGHSTT